MVLKTNPGIVDLAKMSVRDLKCSRFVYGVGWTHESKHEEMLAYVEQLWAYSEDGDARHWRLTKLARRDTGNISA